VLSGDPLRTFARIARLVLRLVAAEERSDYLFDVLASAHEALFGASRDALPTIELVSVARILYALGYLSAEALGDALFVDAAFGADRLAHAETARALSQVDVVLNALHGGVGENGSVQRILERAGIPYAGARAHAAALSYNKSLAREALRAAGVRMPEAIGFTLSDEIPTAQMARDVFARFGPPYVLKPSAEGGGHGIVIAPTIVDLPIMLADLLETFGSVVVEQFVHGRESVVALIDDFRGEELYALPPLRVVLPEGEHILHTGARETARLMPQSDFSHTEKQDLRPSIVHPGPRGFPLRVDCRRQSRTLAIAKSELSCCVQSALLRCHPWSRYRARAE
jgi:hypothetical protein